MADRVLVPYDGSPPATQALEFALETFPEASITVMYVVQVPDHELTIFEGPELRVPVSEKAREYAEELLEGATETAADRGRDLETEIATGKPDHRIVEYAAEGGYDVVVVGSHGREGVSRILLGSVAESVARRSPTPVVVAR